MANRTPAPNARNRRASTNGSTYSRYSEYEPEYYHQEPQYYYDDEPTTERAARVGRVPSGQVRRRPTGRYTPNSRRRPTGRRRSGRRLNGFGKATLIGVLFILAAVGAYAGYFYRHSEAMRRYAAPVLMDATVANQFPNVNTFNLMVIGRDYDYDNQDNVIKTHARSDMLMVAHIDFAAKTARILSIPRDTAAQIPGHGLDKINAAHAMGGPQLTAATIQQNFGITPDHYIALDFQGFQEAIDKLGGVDCAVDKKMDYDDNWGHLHIHLMPGPQHLDGEQAMGFVRFRHSDSDLVRTQRQQTLLAGLKEKLVKPTTLAALPALLDIVDKHIDSDLTDGQKVALSKFLHSLPKENVQMTTLPSIEGGELVQTDMAQAEPIVKSIFNVDIPSQSASAQEAKAVRHHRRHHHHTVDTATADTSASNSAATQPPAPNSAAPQPNGPEPTTNIYD